MENSQLQNEIKKNKTLLQSNFRLMEENQSYLSGLMKLKKHLQPNQSEDISNIQEAQQFINFILSQSFARSQSKKCQCQKWKQLYIRQSQETLRLSTLYSKQQEKLTNFQNRMNEDKNQMNQLLKDYLVLFRKVNEPSFLIEMNEKLKQKVKGSQKKEKRSTSRGKTKGIKKSQQQQSQQQWKQLEAIFKLIEDFKQQVQKQQMTIIELREEANDKEILLSVYRNKEREKLMYGQFM